MTSQPVTLREWKASRAELLTLLQKLTDEQLHTHFVLPWGASGTIEDVVEIFTEHEETHAKEIRELVTKAKEN
jgi:exopolyphosphatase/pppGpp-phosphohydrolase